MHTLSSAARTWPNVDWHVAAATSRTTFEMNIIDFPNEPWQPRRNKTAFEKLQERIQRELAPIRQLTEVQELIRRASPDYHVKEMLKHIPGWQLKEILDNSLPRHLQDLLEKNSALTQVQQMLDKYIPKHQFGLSDDILRQVKGIHSINEIANVHNRYIAPLTEAQSWFKEIENQAWGGHSLLELSRQLEYANPALKALETARASLDELTRVFWDADFSDFELDEEESTEAHQVVQTITQAATAEPTLQAAVDQIIAAIHAQPNPSVQMVLWLFFRKTMDWIIAGIIGAVISQHMPQTTPQSPQEATKAIREVARTSISSTNLLSEYRFVSVANLSVRQNPKARSPKIGQLAFGQSVHLLKKENDFALIQWADKDSETEIQGWVFARYLKKFN